MFIFDKHAAAGGPASLDASMAELCKRIDESNLPGQQCKVQFGANAHMPSITTRVSDSNGPRPLDAYITRQRSLPLAEPDDTACCIDLAAPGLLQRGDGQADHGELPGHQALPQLAKAAALLERLDEGLFIVRQLVDQTGRRAHHLKTTPFLFICPICFIFISDV